MKRLCAHCGERIELTVVCPLCGADLSDLAYHSGREYAISDHADQAARKGDEAHLDLLD